MGKLTNARAKWLEEYGEEKMFERILSGETVRGIMFSNSQDAPQGWAQKAFDIKRLMDINPRQPTLKDLLQILDAAY